MIRGQQMMVVGIRTHMCNWPTVEQGFDFDDECV